MSLTVASVYCQRSALQVRSRHRRRRRRFFEVEKFFRFFLFFFRQPRRHRDCLRRSWDHVEGPQKVTSQTPIDVYSGDAGAHPKPA
jgi:hypothetical protein